jgi:hypothetical protein
MKRSTKVVLAIGGIFIGVLAAEQVFLSRLQYSVIHDDVRLDAFLKSLHYPIWVEPGFGFCRFGGSKWSYTYQLCVYSQTSLGCPLDSYYVQYLGPQSKFHLLTKDYHDSELMFRRLIVTIDARGNICSDRRND